MTEAWDVIMAALGVYAVWRTIEVTQDATWAVIDLVQRHRRRKGQ